MATIQWRPEINALTTPQSYRIFAVPRNSAGIEDLAADIALRHPNYNEADILTILHGEDEAIQERLLNGEQVTKEGSFSWFLSFTGRLESPDAPLPPLNESLQVNVRISPPFVAAIRHAAQTERLPVSKKLPLINTAEDTVLELRDVLNPQGLLRLTGNDLYFDYKQGGGECMIKGTQSGSTIQTRFGKIMDSEVIIMPDIPAQAEPWNNEYTVSISTRYSEHGTLRTGAYGRMLRTPLAVISMGHPNPPDTGILTNSNATPYVTITGGSVSGDTLLLIQVIQDLPGNQLLFNLIDGGAAGTETEVTADGAYSLAGFAGSQVSALNITVNDYAGLWEMVRNDYSGRLVDVLAVTV